MRKLFYMLLLLLFSLNAYSQNALEYYEDGIEYLEDYEKSHSGYDFNKALHCFNKAIELKENYKDAYYSRGKLFLKSKELQRALSDFTIVVFLDSNDYTAYNSLGYTLLEGANSNDEINEAVNCYSKAILINPNSGLSYYNRGICFARLGQYLTACKDMEKAVSLGFDEASLYLKKYCK